MPENGHDILKLYYVQMRESGYINHYVTVMLADTKAKTVTSLLTQLTVLADRAALYCKAFFGPCCLNQVFFKSRWDGLEGSYRKYWLCPGLCVLRYVPDSRRDGAKWFELIVSVMKIQDLVMLSPRQSQVD
jgi:hypothetical protein